MANITDPYGYLIHKINEILNDDKIINDVSRDYEVSLTKLVNSGFDINVANNILKSPSTYGLRNVNLSSSTEPTKDFKTLYAIFYCINIYHRHHFNKEKLDVIWNQYFLRFKDKFKSINHLNVNRFLLELNFCSDFKRQEEILKCALNDAIDYPQNAGYQHAFAALFVDIAEKNEKDAKLYDKIVEVWYNDAINAINIAINLDSNYARYYCTKGRMLSMKGKYIEADEQICTAIVKEDSLKTDYAIRINKYQYYRIQNKSKMQLKDIQLQIENEQEEINKMRNSVISNIETIALFSGVVSFILGTLTITNKTSVAHAALLIVVLMSCLMIVFVAFILLLHSSDKKFNKGSCYFLLIFSIIIIIISIIIMGVSNDKYHICFFKTWE